MKVGPVEVKWNRDQTVPFNKRVMQAALEAAVGLYRGPTAEITPQAMAEHVGLVVDSTDLAAHPDQALAAVLLGMQSGQTITGEMNVTALAESIPGLSALGGGPAAWMGNGTVPFGITRNEDGTYELSMAGFGPGEIAIDSDGKLSYSMAGVTLGFGKDGPELGVGPLTVSKGSGKGLGLELTLGPLSISHNKD